jgi:hypothetical protein
VVIVYVCKSSIPQHHSFCEDRRHEFGETVEFGFRFQAAVSLIAGSIARRYLQEFSLEPKMDVRFMDSGSIVKEL